MPRARAGTMLGEALAVVALYMLVRAALVAALPVHTHGDWARLDAWKTIPRLGCFLLLFALNRWRWLALRLDFAAPEGALRTLLFLAGTAAVYALSYVDHYSFPLPRGVVAVGLADTLFVVLFEEYAFRGALLEGLRARIGTPGAILGSSLLFAVYHIQAQPVADWPGIFGFGVVAASLRTRGIGLGWLMAVHFVVDGYWLAGISPLHGHLGSWAFLAVMAAYATLTWPRRIRGE